MRHLLLVVCTLALLAAGCGGGDSAAQEGAEPDPAATGGGSGDYPVTVEHAAGTATIEERPERIVSLNVQWTDALLAMGVEPAAFVLDSATGESEPYPWQTALLDGVERIDVAGEVPFEQIAALQPDLILVTFLATDASQVERLAQIAPTIGLLGERQVDRWQDQVEVLGDVLGDPARADEVIADVEGQVADLAEQLPGLDGKTYLAANYIPGDSIWVVADPDDGASELFNELGMTLPPDILETADGATGRVQLSFEQVALMESDFLAILPNGGDPHDLPGYDELTSVTSGAVAEMEFADVVGVNTPTPLSIPYVVDLLRPGLEAAAAA